MKTGRVVLILGDQLDRSSPALTRCDKENDLLLMIESRQESERVWSHKARTTLFLSAMRHHAQWLKNQDYQLEYIDIHHPQAGSFVTALSETIRTYQPDELLMVEAGEHGVQEVINATCQKHHIDITVIEDPHYLCSHDEFSAWLEGRRVLVMEHFYRHMRKREQILMEDGQPTGQQWNLDKENRKPFGKEGPGMIPAFQQFELDAITQTVIEDVQKVFPDNPGTCDHFNWPVTREQALELLDQFIYERLCAFGPYQDAMWQGETMLYHSGLASALNLKLLNPREVITAVEQTYHAGLAPLQSVEGFIRQVLGWREYVRGIYWSQMPGYLDSNSLAADHPLPDFFWTADTDMNCLRQTIEQTLQLGYAHHIQRLMVTGLFALLYGVRPKEIHEWYLAVYIDAVEWVEAPNTIGMSQYADGGLLASKPYVASGRYIQRMSNYCTGCRYAPDKSTGENACPFTTLYWDFLMRHEERFSQHPRARLQWRNLERLDEQQKLDIRKQAESIRSLLS
jgi:deoxyribodipyrimidine photolyase-related protein